MYEALSSFRSSSRTRLVSDLLKETNEDLRLQLLARTYLAREVHIWAEDLTGSIRDALAMPNELISIPL